MKKEKWLTEEERKTATKGSGDSSSVGTSFRVDGNDSSGGFNPLLRLLPRSPSFSSSNNSSSVNDTLLLHHYSRLLSPLSSLVMGGMNGILPCRRCLLLLFSSSI
ncbi:hypothetical protein PIB30_077264 [Stylosanthes scabra]|uniref:Uncharacterized protein n=1 Tax=Stylosanthes scabra TaxID=79078 RepID=A0ABU6QQ30_9FABA|nr:hypothetical protein [Stylosanthes scabra]